MTITVHREPILTPPISSVTLELTPQEFADLQTVARVGFNRLYAATGCSTVDLARILPIITEAK